LEVVLLALLSVVLDAKDQHFQGMAIVHERIFLLNMLLGNYILDLKDRTDNRGS